MVSQRGFGPPTCGLGNRYSVQLSYWDMLKLVAVLWVSTPLSLQREASNPIYVREPVLRTGQDQIPEYQAIETWRGIRVPPSEFQIDSLV